MMELRIKFRQPINLLARKIFLIFSILLCSLIGYAPTAFAFAQDRAIEKPSSWQHPTAEKISSTFDKWLESQDADPERREQVQQFLDANTNSPESPIAIPSIEPIDLVIDALSLIRDDVAKFRSRLSQARPTEQTIEINKQLQLTNLLDNPGEPSLVSNHVRLYYGRWLARNQLYDESLEQLSELKVADVLDPASLLFYRGLMEHQLLKKEACLKSIEQLLENETTLPRRFAVLAQLMLSDIKPLKEDTLDEISRMMGDVGRRTGLYRSGKRVREQEEEVIKKLDKIIEDIENQQQQMSMNQSGQDGAPQKPMEDSQRASGKASGDVKSKTQIDGGQWGDLPPAERAAALAEMAKDMPPHYRAVIEEYFRQLAQENEKR